MEAELLKQGFIALVPATSTIIALTVFFTLVFLAGRATALRHLVKHHLTHIHEDETKRLVEENERKDKYIKKLEARLRMYLDTLSGIRHLTRKNLEEIV